MKECNDELIKPTEDDLGFLLWKIMRLWQRERQKGLDEFNTTVSQLELLAGIHYLSLELGEVTQIVLSQETGIDPMTTSTILRNLEKKGLVSRRPSKTDTRARSVFSTNEGNQLLFAALKRIRRTQEELLEKINKKIIITELQKLLRELESKTLNDNNR